MFNRILLLGLGLIVFLSHQLNAQLYINEMMAVNDATIADAAGEYDDWIEIYNDGPAIDIAGYHLTDDPTDPLKWQIPNTNSALTTIPTNGFLILWADQDTDQGEDHIDLKLSSNGETLLLTSPDGTVLIDSMSFSSLTQDHSFGRETDGGTIKKTFSVSSPNASNITGTSKVAEVQFSQAGGVYTNTVNVTLSTNTSASTIRYTTDGSEPDGSSPIYNGPISVNDVNTIRAKGFRTGWESSLTTSQSYLVGVSHSLAIVTINTHPDNLWDDQIGIHVEGTNGTTGNCSSTPVNWNQKWDRPANVQFYDENGNFGFNIDAGISIAGGCSRRFTQKSFNVETKSIYPSENIPYQLFPNRDQHEFRRFKLRSGGNEWYRSRLRDAAAQSFVENEVDIDMQSVRPVVVYLNDEYWGIMKIRDVHSQHSIKYKHPKVDKDSINLMKVALYEPVLDGDFEVNEGQKEDFHDLYNFFVNNDLSLTANYDYVESKIDINEYINYSLVNIYVANVDWPSWNLDVWHEQGGKARWLAYDLDMGFGYASTWQDHRQNTADFDMLSFATQQSYNGHPNDKAGTLMLYKILQNIDFQNEFIQRYATQMSTLFTAARTVGIVNDLRNEMAPDMPGQLAKFSLNSSSMASWHSQVDFVEDWLNDRPPYAYTNVQNYFGISGTYNLTIPVNANTNGSVLLNSNEYQAPYNYVGKYFDNIPMILTAVANPGYRFSHWLETGNTNAQINITYSTDQTLTPVFVPSEDIVINEIHYNPMLNEQEEFIEINNPSTDTRDLSGYKFDKGLCFEFPDGTMIAPGEYIIIARDATIYSGNGYQVFQWEDSKLSNSGENITLQNRARMTVDSLTYDDALPWKEEADGMDFSLALLNPSLDNVLAASWDVQSVDKITPGAQNTFCPNITSTQLINHPLCSGINDGQATIILSQGNAGYNFSWSHGPVGASVNNLTPGLYTMTAMDAFGCSITDTIIIYSPTTQLTASLSKIEESFFGANNGSINLTTSVVNALSYLWSTGDTTEDIGGLSAGTYTVDITDVNGCITTESITLNPGPQHPVAAATFTPNNAVAPANVSFSALGSSDSDGSIVSYNWDFGDGNTGSGVSPSHNYVSTGTYAVTLIVTDSQGLTDTITLAVNVISPCDAPTSLSLISASSNTLIVSWQGDSDAGASWIVSV